MTDTFEGSPQGLNSVEADRFSQALTMAMVKNQYSQRKLCEAMDITMGTMTKYFKGKIIDKVNVMTIGWRKPWASPPITFWLSSRPVSTVRTDHR